MGWSVDEVRKMREEMGRSDRTKAAQAGSRAGNAGTRSSTAGGGLTPAQVRQVRTQMNGTPTGSAVTTDRQEDYEPDWNPPQTTTTAAQRATAANSKKSLGTQVLAQMSGTPTGSAVATDRQEDYEPDWNYVGTDSTPKQRAIAQGTYGSYAKTAQQVGQTLAKDRPTDTFDRLNQWMDESPRHRQLVSLMRQGKDGTAEALALGSSTGDRAVATRQEYSPGELLKMGYTAEEINGARKYIREYDALPASAKAIRRTADDIKGITATVGAALPLAGETLVQAGANIKATRANERALNQSLADDARAQELKNLITAVDMDYKPQYTDTDLLKQGYSRKEIDDMRKAVDGVTVKTTLDKDTSLGYQLYNYGKERSAAAVSGLGDTERTAMGIASSTAENLAVAGISPALVLPVLSAQGGAEAMGQSVEKGESAGKTLTDGVLKFGAGWAINSVGAADLAKTMGSDYAKDTLAGKLADVVRSVAADGTLAQQYPAVANAISGGVDNAMQAFVETYADKAIDAALGDSEAAADFFKPETFLAAVESGLTGGASGALGGAVGTGLAKANGGDASLVGNIRRAEYESRAEKAQQTARDILRAQEQGMAMQQTQEEAAAGARQPEASVQRTAMQETVQPEVTSAASGSATMQDTAPMAQSKKPAVQQFAAAVQDGQLTSKIINLFTPNAANEANRAAFAEEYGVELPETASKTRQALRELAAQQQKAQASAATTENATVKAQKMAATVENMEADRSAQQAQTESELGRSGAAVENTGETVESSMAKPGGQRETYGFTQQSLTAKQREVQQELTRWKVSDGASTTISKNMPVEVGDAERYAAAASSLYRLGQMEDVKTFDKAMELALGSENLAINTKYVLRQDGGQQALQLAWMQGRGELEAANTRRGVLGGNLTKESTSGSGRVIYYGTSRTANEVGTQLIELNAKATDTDAVMKAVLQGSDRVKAYVDTETARIFFSDYAEDVFGTILHEDYHWYNSLDAEGAQALQRHALEYLAKSEGFETIDEMIREKLADYAQQSLTYDQAAEELVADAWRGIFSDETSFKRWVEFQRQQAEKNAGKAGTIRKVMAKVKEMLTDIISRAKEVLAKDPENKAALKAQRLAEAEKRALQDEYFAHAEKAMDNLRAAKENAAALENKGAAQGARFKLHEDSESLTEQMNAHLGELEEMEPVAEIRGNEVKFGKNARENIENIDAFFDSIGNEVERENFGMVELKHYGANKTVRHGNSAAKQAAVAAIPGVIRNGNQIGYEKNWQGRGYDTYVFAGPVVMDETRINEAVIVNSYTREDGRKAFYTHEVCWSDGSYVTFDDAGKPTKKEDTPTHLPMDVRNTTEGVQEASSNISITQEDAENKGNDGTLKKNVRYQLSKTDELTKLREERRQLDERRRALKEERNAWLESDAVKEIEARKKALGIFSAEAKAYRDSEEYQNYLAKRKDYNARIAQLDDQSTALDDRIKAAGDRMQQRAAAGEAEQAAYDAKAETYGGKAEYRRALAKEQFGTTEDFNRAGYILPDGQMLDFAQNDRTRDTDHREIMNVFGPAEVRNGTEALNEFLLDGNVRVMAEGPGIDISADTAPTAQQLEQIRRMAQDLGSARRQFTLDISTADGRVAASKEYSGRVDADRIVREIRDYYRTGELAQESDLARFRYQLAEQADRDAKRNAQRQASHTIADKAAALDTLSQFFGLARGVKVSRTAIEGLTSRWAKANGSRVDRAKLARETEVLAEYLTADGADMEKAQALAETLAGEVLDGAMQRSSELWDEYPELHKLTYTVNKNGSAKAELVKAYGGWSAAVAEARQHGVTLRQADGVRDGNPAELYESYVNDARAADGTRNGARALWQAAAGQAGVAGSASMESTEWLNVLMNLHDAIRPVTQSKFADNAEYEDARMELASQMIGDILNVPEMTDAEAIFEGIQRHNMEVARAAAGSEERAAEVEKSLRSVQREQAREFDRRLYRNRRTASQNAEVQQMNALRQENAKAQQQVDQSLAALGADITNAGDLNERLTFLRENYARQAKQEAKRMRAERQEMLDEAGLEIRQLKAQNHELQRQVKGEQKRADWAEYTLMAQEEASRERGLMDQQKAAEWYRQQAEHLAIEREAARQQRDEDIAIAKSVAEKRVQRARDGRKMDELKRGVRRNAAQLNQLTLRPSPGKYVQQSLIRQAAEVAKLADAVMLNQRAVLQLTALEDSIAKSAGSEDAPNAMTEEWEQSKVPEMIRALRDDLATAKQAKLDELNRQLAEAEALPDSEQARALQERIEKRIREADAREYLPTTVDQMRLLKDITSATLHVIRNANRTLSLAKAEEVDKIAEGVAGEVQQSKGNHPGGKLDGAHSLLTKYQLDMLGAERVFRMLGGYAKNSQMEKMAKMLNDGQYQQTKITIEGEKMFAAVTGPDHVKEMQKFAGPGAELVDIGLKDSRNEPVMLTHAQLCSLFMHLQNADSLRHLMNGGLTVPDTKLYNKGSIERAYQEGQTVHLGLLTNADGAPMETTILQTVEDAMTDYDRAWCSIMKEFFGSYTTNLINDTSMKLLGYQRATVKNYYPIAVDKGALATQIEGLNLNATIEGRGFLKNRVKSSQPILLEECSSVVQRSLRDTAAYAGMAVPIRDVQKILNATVDTGDGIANLKNGIIMRQWGKDAVSYIDDLLTDLQTKPRKRKSTLQWLGKLSSKYAGAVLTLNPGVALAQAASLPTAAAVLGGDTMAAVVPFVKNLSPKARTALETEIKEHGDVLLDWRKRGSQKGELASIGRQETLAEKGMDKLPKVLTGWINGMDEVTVAALWEGSKQYVHSHAAEFEGAEVTGSPAYWEAVNRTYQKVIEQTQPNYTVMQRAGIQRNPDGMAKALTMFTTQRFQNYGILADAIGDYKAQTARYKAESSAENKAEAQRAGKQLRRAVASQTVQTVTFALMKMGVGFLLHRWKNMQDENGDMTLKSLLKRFGELCMESFAGTGLYGSEVYSFASNAVTGNDYDVVSAANLGLVNEFAAAAGKFAYELRKDTGGMDEEEVEKHDQKLWTLAENVMEAGLQALGIPYANGKKFAEAAEGWYATVKSWRKSGEYGNFNSLPESATGQYDRLYNAYLNGDSVEAKAAVEKLEAMVEAGTIKENKMYSQLKSRLVKYDARVQQAAEAQNAGNDRKRYELEIEMIEQLSDALGLPKGAREDVIDCVTGAVNQLADEQLKGDGISVTDALVEAVDSWDAEAVQEELDRLMRAGKSAKNLKTKITETAKPEYLAGSDADRQRLEEMLLALEDADGNALYTEKSFAAWERNAEKAEEKEPEADPYAEVR